MKLKATEEMSNCVNFNHYFAKGGQMTCAIPVKDENGEIGIKYKRCTLFDNQKCSEYKGSVKKCLTD